MAVGAVSTPSTLNDYYENFGLLDLATCDALFGYTAYVPATSLTTDGESLYKMTGNASGATRVYSLKRMTETPSSLKDRVKYAIQVETKIFKGAGEFVRLRLVGAAASNGSGGAGSPSSAYFNFDDSGVTCILSCNGSTIETKVLSGLGIDINKNNVYRIMLIHGRSGTVHWVQAYFYINNVLVHIMAPYKYTASASYYEFDYGEFCIGLDAAVTSYVILKSLLFSTVG